MIEILPAKRVRGNYTNEHDYRLDDNPCARVRQWAIHIATEEDKDGYAAFENGIPRTNIYHTKEKAEKAIRCL